ncbi:hypothetical protein RB195_013766 [Necator americanus]
MKLFVFLVCTAVFCVRVLEAQPLHRSDDSHLMVKRPERDGSRYGRLVDDSPLMVKRPERDGSRYGRLVDDSSDGEKT